MARTGRPPSCECGTCAKCKRRERARARYQALSPDERRAIVARRDKEKQRASDRARYYRNLAQRRERMREWAKENREKVRQANREYQERYPEKRRARNILWNALRDGFIVRPSVCDRCREECQPQAHHHDYSQPLDVLWLCTECHGREHRQYEDSRRAA